MTILIITIATIFICIYTIYTSILRSHIAMLLTSSMISFCAILIYSDLQAYDIGITESVLNAGVSSLFFFLGYLIYSVIDTKKYNESSQIFLKSKDKKIHKQNDLGAIGKITFSISCLIFGIILFYAVFVSATNQNQIENINCKNEIDQSGSKITNNHNLYICYDNYPIRIKSLVSAILAGYRGFDTICETCVIVITSVGIAYTLKNRDNAKELQNSD